MTKNFIIVLLVIAWLFIFVSCAASDEVDKECLDYEFRNNNSSDFEKIDPLDAFSDEFFEKTGEEVKKEFKVGFMQENIEALTLENIEYLGEKMSFRVYPQMDSQKYDLKNKVWTCSYSNSLNANKEEVLNFHNTLYASLNSIFGEPDRQKMSEGMGANPKDAFTEDMVNQSFQSGTHFSYYWEYGKYEITYEIYMFPKTPGQTAYVNLMVENKELS